LFINPVPDSGQVIGLVLGSAHGNASSSTGLRRRKRKRFRFMCRQVQVSLHMLFAKPASTHRVKPERMLSQYML
jgi:hypothetical protein